MKRFCVGCGEMKEEYLFPKSTPNSCRDCTNGFCYYVFKGLIECPNCKVFRRRDDFKKLYRDKPARGLYCNYCIENGFTNLPSNSDGDTKKCNGCLDIKPVTEFFTYIDNRVNKVYYRGYCKDCDRKYCKVKYKDYLYCRDCKKYRPRLDFDKNVRRAKYVSQCTQCRRKSDKEYRDNLPEGKKREYWIKYKETHEEYERRRIKKWISENKDKFSTISQRYRTNLKNLEDTLTGEEWASVLSYFKDTCAVCDSQDKIELDHWIPISWGQIGNIKENVVPLCKYHNMSKSNRNPNKWITIADNVNFEKTVKLYEYLAEINGLTVEEYKEFIDLCYKDRDRLKRKKYTRKNRQS